MSITGNIHTRSLESQVAGHTYILTNEDGRLLIKPSLPREIEFYERLQNDEKLAILKRHIPKFFGTLRLEGEAVKSKPQEAGIGTKPIKPRAEKKDRFLENISHRFSKPNILDIKLGTILYDDQAGPEKVARMTKNARNTTSFESGIRLTGFQVHNNVTGIAINTPTSYGKSIKVADLPDGIARFFPVGVQTTNALAEGSSGLPASLLRPILKGIREEVKKIRDAFAGVELRMAGGSLLIIYESDWYMAQEGVKRLTADENEDDEDKDDEDEGDEDHKPALPFVVKLIDFVHTRLVPGEGADAGVLFGMGTVLRLLDGRLKAIAH